jgi:hypothetical protein
LVVDELFMFFEVTFVAVEECIHVVVSEGETELDRQEIIADEGHE